MKKEYKLIFDKIKKKIEKNGILTYIQNWNPYTMKDSYENKDAFYEDLNKYVKSYHHHCSISINKNNVLNNVSTKYDKKIPKFYYDQKNNIGKIIFYHYYIDFNDEYHNDIIYKKIVESVNEKMEYWKSIKIKGLIIDLRNHYGGWYQPFFDGLKILFKDKSLFCMKNSLCSKKSKSWVNFKNNDMIYNCTFNKNNKLNNFCPIVCLIGKKTSSTGEFCASAFYRDQNDIKIIGLETAGNLSTNGDFNITNNIKLHLTISLITTTDGVFHCNEKCIPQIKTNSPIKEAVKFILNYN
jgi:hypothetical protein